MKDKFRGKIPSTSYSKSGDEDLRWYNKELLEMDISSLRFESWRHKKEAVDIANNYDMDNPEAYNMYKKERAMESMANEMLYNKILDQEASPTHKGRDEVWDSETGLVYDGDGKVSYGIYFNEDEDGYIYKHEDDDVKILSEAPISKPRSRKDVYENWNYTEDEEEDYRKD